MATTVCIYHYIIIGINIIFSNCSQCENIKPVSLVKQYETGKDNLTKLLNKSVLTVTNKRFLKIAVCSSPSLVYLFCALISGKYRDILKILRANSSDNITV